MAVFVKISFVIITLYLLTSKAFALTFAIDNDIELKDSLAKAKAGDTLVLASNTTFHGQIKISVGIKIQGGTNTILDGKGIGNGITISPNTENVTVSNLTIVNWGRSKKDFNAGIHISSAKNIQIDNNILKGSSSGILIDNSKSLIITNNKIYGQNPQKVSYNRLGDGINIDKSNNIFLLNNIVKTSRDGIYLNRCTNIQIHNNKVTYARYAIHFMDSHIADISFNRASNVAGGFAMMFSDYLYLHHNLTDGASQYGVLLNYSFNSTVMNNKVTKVYQQKEEMLLGNEGKALFIYTASNNIVKNNLFTDNEIGIQVSSGSENNIIYSNSFIYNEMQVKYAGDDKVEWSNGGVGNYWSDYEGWDFDNKDIGLEPFVPNDKMDRLFWYYPEAKTMMTSPIIVALRWIQSQFPVVELVGVIDSHPLKYSPWFEIKNDE